MDFISIEQGKEQYYQLDEKAIVVAVESSGKSVARIFDNSTRHQLRNFLQKASLSIGEISQLKMVGPASIVSGATTILSNITDTPIKTVEREGKLELFFYPSEGRIRVNKSTQQNAMTKSGPIKVLIVDDSKTIRTLLSKIFAKSSDIEVVAMAEKPSEVEELIEKHQPDVLTLDIHMPEMTGVDLLKIIAPKYRIPTIMVTSISMEEGPLVLEALESGAFDYIQKPDISELAEVSKTLIQKVKQASLSSNCVQSVSKVSVKKVNSLNTDSLVVIGSSTGGTNAIRDILTKLPSEIPPILIVQHIPPVFSKAFADRMNSLCPFHVKEAKDGDTIEKNTVYVAPGGKQMKPLNKGGSYVLEINEDEPVNRFKPSVDYMFKHVVPLLKRKHIVSVVLTGMGKDGAREMLNLKNNGALTIAQNEESCVVYGMPKEAINIGAAMAIEHKDDIASKIAEFSWENAIKKEA